MATAYLPSNISSFEGSVLSYKETAVLREASRVTSVAISPSGSTMASTASLRLSLYDGTLCEQTHVISRFKLPVYGVKFRNDGQIIGIGGEEGKIRIYDNSVGSNKAALRVIKVAETAVHSIDFSASNRHVFALADNGSLHQVDISSGSVVHSLSAHRDIGRSLICSRENENIVLTGGYDHMVKMWDMRQENAVMQMECEAPIEGITFMPSEQMAVVAHGTTVKIFTLGGGQEYMSNTSAHHKVITSVCLLEGGSVLATCGMDRRVQFLSTSGLSPLFSLVLPSPILSMAFSAKGDTAIFAQNTFVAIHRRVIVKKVEKLPGTTVKITRAPSTITIEKDGKKEKRTMTASNPDQAILLKEDALLRKYRHAALLTRLFGGKSKVSRQFPEKMTCWLAVIVRRSAIHRSLAGQNPAVISNLVKFLVRYAFREELHDTLFSVCEAFIDVLSSEMWSLSPSVLSQVSFLRRRVEKELATFRSIEQSLGAIQMVNTRRKRSEEEADVFGDAIIANE